MSRPAFSFPLAGGHYPGSALVGSAPIAHPTKKKLLGEGGDIYANNAASQPLRNEVESLRGN